MTGTTRSGQVAGEVEFGPQVRVVRIKEWASGRIDIRTIIVCAVLLLLTSALSFFAIGTGDYVIAPKDVLSALFGDAPRITEIIVLQSRLPRVALAVMFGAALGVSGAVFQSLTRNPLGSPDVIGFTTGAYTGALVVIVTLGGGYYRTGAGALLGGLATAMVVYLLAYRRGVQGFRLIIVGIAVSAMLASVNTWLVVKADLTEAIAAAVWGAGSLNGLGWQQVVPSIVALTVVMPLLAILSRRMPMLELGDDAATALGVRVESTRLMLIFLGVALTALVTAAAGPISFIALAAPQLARRLTGASGAAMVPAACMGSVLLVASDVAAQRVFAPTQLPVGVVTVCVGGAYFVWLLAREGRNQ